MSPQKFIHITLLNIFIFFLFVGANPSYAEPDQSPLLRIETGAHTNMIRRVSVDARCSVAVTSSDDKTVRLWSLQDGQIIRTMRVPIGAGHEGKSFSVAISPDGRYVAAGGWDAQYAEDSKMRVYIFDANSGQVIKRIGDATSVYNHLEFSKDGQYLGAVLGGSQGMRVWRTYDWREVASDTKYSGDSYGAAFGPDNTFYTTSYDGLIRKYAPENFRLVKKVAVKNHKEAFGIAVDPTGRKVAVGLYRRSIVEVYNTADLSYAFTPDLADVKKNEESFISVAWSSDGQRLYTGGAYWDPVSQTRPIRMWGAGGRSAGINMPGFGSTVMGIVPCGDKIAIGAADPVFALMTQDLSRKIIWRDNVIADLRGKYSEHFTISPTGTALRFGLGYQSADPVIFDLENGSITDSPYPATGFHQGDNTSLPIKNWDEGYEPSYRGKTLTLDSYEQSRSLAIRPDGQGFVLGANWSLRSYDKQGNEIWKFQTPSVVWGLNMTKDSQVVIAAYGDGSIRWYRVKDGKELLSLFINAKDRRWVAWTSKGYYAASAGGEDLIGWHINRNWNQSADFFPSSRFRDTFYRPDIVKQVLTLLDEDEAIREANRASQRKESDEDIRKRLPPVINIINPLNGGSFTNPSMTLEYSLRSPSGLDITKIDVLLDGRPIDKNSIDAFSIPAEGQSGQINVRLPARSVNLSLVAYTKQATSEAVGVSLSWGGQVAQQSSGGAGDDINKPKLYALLVGVSDYKKPEYKLNFAAKDAEDFARTLKAQEGGVYREVVIKTLTNSDATAGNIREALGWLEGEVTSRDVGLLFLAGHGMTDTKQRFYYMPYEGDSDKLISTAIPQSDIQNVISGLAGKALMFVDACHSAGSFGATTQTRGLSLVDINGVVNELSSAENGVVMFASSTGRQLSMEDTRWQNGAFTKALLEGFQGKADYNKNDAISIAELDLWLSERVKELTEKRQHPVARRPPTVPDFPIAIPK